MSGKEDDRDELVTRAGAGDREALSRVLESLLPSLRRIALTRLRGAPSVALDADDLVSETVARLFSRSTFEGLTSEAHLYRFAARVMESVLWDSHRREARRRGRLPSHGELDPDATPDKSASGMDDERIIAEALASLPDDLREVMELSQIGLTTSEIANRTELSESAVKRRLQRARQKLQQPDRGSERESREAAEHRPPVSGTGPARIAVVWDPETIPPNAYSKIIEILGDIAREEGGRGIERIREQTMGVETNVGVRT